MYVGLVTRQRSASLHKTVPTQYHRHRDYTVPMYIGLVTRQRSASLHKTVLNTTGTVIIGYGAHVGLVTRQRSASLHKTVLNTTGKVS